MEDGEISRYAALVSFEATSKTGLVRIIKEALDIGGILVSTQVDIEQTQRSKTYVLNREDVDEILEKHKISTAWKTRYWSALADIQSTKEFPDLHPRDRPMVGFIDLRIIRSRLTEAEEGEPMPLGIGPKIWDILSDTISERFSADPDVKPLLPWDSEVHPRLENISTGQEVVAMLAGRYALQL